MRFTIKYTKPKMCDKRIVKKFAFFPIVIICEGIWEFRWLERVKIEQYYADSFDTDFVDSNYSGHWYNLRFIND